VEFTSWADSPHISLFKDFDIRQEPSLVGEDESKGRRSLRLSIVRDAEELAAVGGSRQGGEVRTHTTENGAYESAQVLKLRSNENDEERVFHLIMDGAGMRTVPIPPSPPFPASLLGGRSRVSFKENAERLGNLRKLRKQQILVDALKILEPRLSDIDVVVERGEPTIQGDIGLDRLVPLPYMGDGMTRLADIVLAAAGHARDGVLLVDEIENGLYHSILPKVWQAIGQVAREANTQVFATTHSRECIVAAQTAFCESQYDDFRLHRLEQIDGTIQAVTYTPDQLEAAIEMGLEVR
jgi:hypothetical protein